MRRAGPDEQDGLARRALRAGLCSGLLLLLAALTACASTPPPQPIEPETDLHHPDPGRRALAVQDLAARGDRRYLPDLIELLDDRDEAVRLVAGAALTELTGREGDYRAFAPRAQRLEAMGAWRAWYESSAAAEGAQP